MDVKLWGETLQFGKLTSTPLAINLVWKIEDENTFLFHRSHLSNKCLRDSQLSINASNLLKLNYLLFVSEIKMIEVGGIIWVLP